MSISSCAEEAWEPLKVAAKNNEIQNTPSTIDVPPQKGRIATSVAAASIRDSLLREYAMHLDPLNTGGDPRAESDGAPSSGLSDSSTQVNDSPQDSAASLPTSPLLSLRAPKSFLSHRKGTLSTDSVTHQSILKALASRPPNSGIPTVNIAASLSGMLNNSNDDHRHQHVSSHSRHLSAALSDINLSRIPSTAKFTSLQSPCFFHKRFDDAINIDRVLEEIAAEDDGMSHSRLMQTATSVREISKQLQRRPIKRAVRNVMIVTKARDNSLVYLTRELAEWLLSTPRYGSELGVNVYVDAKLRTSKRFDAGSLLASNPRYETMLRYWTPDLCWSSPEKFDLVLTLGGDGTVLFTSWLFQRVVPPILSFSLGSLGFLTNFAFSSYKSSLGRIMGDTGMRVNLRMRFTCTVYRANLGRKGESKGEPEMVEGEQFEVLNELVIDRGPSPYVSNLELYGDNELLTVVQADGCIFSTPTGSTAYSLSAGGPLTHPSIPGIILTPICPHTLSFRPMVLSDSLLLKVCVPKNSRSTAYASFDGKGRVELRRGDCVQVEAGRYPFPTVVGEHGTGGEWFESVRRALRWNTRGAVQKGFHAKTKVSGEEKGGLLGEEQLNDTEEELIVGDEDYEDEDEEWDINPDPIEVHGAMDSGLGASVQSSNCTSPGKMG
ncbi:NAD(+) kinase [Loxospora ochrophaea]|nr:NAD(+) kinase [Loxospora ochrophaea]